MSVNLIVLWGPTMLGITAVPLGAVCPANSRQMVKNGSFVNYTAGSPKVNIWVSRNGSGTTNATLLVSSWVIGPNGSNNNGFLPPELINLVLTSGDQIFANCDTAAAVNATGSGIQIP